MRSSGPRVIAGADTALRPAASGDRGCARAWWCGPLQNHPSVVIRRGRDARLRLPPSQDGPAYPPGVAAGFAMTTLAMFGFAVNDIFDYHKDRAAGIQRPVAAETLSRKDAAWLAIAMLLAAGVLSAVAGRGWTVMAATGACSFLYSPVAQRFPLCKDAYVAGLCCAPLYYGAAAGGRQYPCSLIRRAGVLRAWPRGLDGFR